MPPGFEAKPEPAAEPEPTQQTADTDYYPEYDDYFDEGSNAQLEFLHALEHRAPGVDLVLAKVSPSVDLARLDAFPACRGLRVYDLSGTREELDGELEAMVRECAALRSASCAGDGSTAPLRGSPGLVASAQRQGL